MTDDTKETPRFAGYYCLNCKAQWTDDRFFVMFPTCSHCGKSLHYLMLTAEEKSEMDSLKLDLCDYLLYKKGHKW